MGDANLILFLTASVLVILAPGPDNILVLTRGVTLGRKAALVSAAGASTGLVCHSPFAAAGLSALLQQSAVASNVFNPKIAVFFLAYLPQFADPMSGGGVALQLLVLGLAFAAMTWAIFSVVALLSGALGGWLRSKPRLANGLSWLTGGVFVTLGLRLALPERR